MGERCPTCHHPLDEGELAVLLADLGANGVTYPIAAFMFGVSVKRLANVVYEHRLERRYRRIGPHPRRHAFLTPRAVRELQRYFPRPLPARPHPAH